MVDDLQQEIAELFLQVRHILPFDGVGDLVGFLDRVGRDAREVLFQIPRAAGDRRPQRRHHGDEIADRSVLGWCAGVVGHRRSLDAVAVLPRAGLVTVSGLC